MRPPSVVVTDVGAEDVFELTAADDQQPLEALAADAPTQRSMRAFRVLRPDGRAGRRVSAAAGHLTRALRAAALGAVREDELLIEQAVDRFDAMASSGTTIRRGN